MHEDPISILDRFPRLRAALLPTPLQELTRLREGVRAGAPRILVKRDDLTGLALGGNKSRKLEFLLADARSKGADSIVSCGAAQSNHALQTAAACRQHGFEVCCVLYGEASAESARKTGNLLLHSFLETPIRWVTMTGGETRREQALRRGIAEEARLAESMGKRVYAIPTGGSTAVGALGYVQAALELRSQLSRDEAKQVRACFFASGSGGTHAGLVAGMKLAEWPVRCIGVEIDPIPADSTGTSPYYRAVSTLSAETFRLLQRDGPDTANDIELDDRFTGPAYGVETEAGREAARSLFRTEGILLDPVYTAKAFAAMLARIEAREFCSDDTVVFWHTGGAPGIFAQR